MQPVFYSPRSIACNIAAVRWGARWALCWRPRTSGTTTSKRATATGAAHAPRMPTAWNISIDGKPSKRTRKRAIGRRLAAWADRVGGIFSRIRTRPTRRTCPSALRQGQRLNLLDAEGLDAAVLYPTRRAFFGRRSLATLDFAWPIAALQPLAHSRISADPPAVG